MRFTLLFAFLFAIGCSSPPPTGLSAELPGTAWTLERVVYDDGRVERGTGEQRITFEPDGRVLIVSCNTCNGTYRMRGNELTMRDPMACTRRGCMEQEIELETFFSGAMTLSRDGSYLIVESLEAADPAQLLFLPVSDRFSWLPPTPDRVQGSLLSSSPAAP
ncbi:MAG: META domain-containing protein [Bacteroidota bacterium]